MQELERQVRGLNNVIKRRFPNSLSALILAASSTSSTSSGGGNPTGMDNDEKSLGIIAAYNLKRLIYLLILPIFCLFHS